MVRDELSVLSAFLAVAEERSFTRAAKRLGVTPSAVSHAIRELEERFGIRLLARTTRSVAPTDAGAQLVARLRPALGDIREAVDSISGLRDRPAGRVRLVVSPLATTTVLAPKLGRFAREYPDVVLDVTSDESRVDLVAGGFDAGVHLGEFIQRDMIVIRVSQDLRPAIVASPRYFDSHPKPTSPRDLLSNRWCGSGVCGRGPRRAASRKWGTGARTGGLVTAVPWFLPLLSKTTAATTGTLGAYRDSPLPPGKNHDPLMTFQGVAGSNPAVPTA